MVTCYIYEEKHTIYRIKIHQIVLELQAFVCKSPFSRMTSACATHLEKMTLKGLYTGKILEAKLNLANHNGAPVTDILHRNLGNGFQQKPVYLS